VDEGKPGITAPIASATSPTQRTELVKAASVNLDAASMAVLDVSNA